LQPEDPQGMTENQYLSCTLPQGMSIKSKKSILLVLKGCSCASMIDLTRMKNLGILALYNFNWGMK